jgi:hypothetical protein
MTENSTGGSPGAGTPPEILTAANAHRSHGKTFGAGTPPLCEGLVELDRLIAKQSQSVSARRQLAETESLPALKASKARNGHPAVRAMPANPRHGKQHRSILAIEEEELLALQSARADYASQSDVARQADDAREKAELRQPPTDPRALYVQLRDAIAALQSENAELRKDAERWQYFRRFLSVERDRYTPTQYVVADVNLIVETTVREGVNHTVELLVDVARFSAGATGDRE